jgi:Domain of unknown function (DUF4845)
VHRDLVRGPRLVAARQRGLSLITMVLAVCVLGFFGVLALRITPTFVEYRAITSAVKKAAVGAHTIPEIQSQYQRSADIDDITSVAGKDLDIQKVDDNFVVSFAYEKKIPLFGPVSVVIDYAGSSKSL